MSKKVNYILSEKSNKIRNILLLICLIDYSLIKVGLLPTSINFSLITIDNFDKNSLIVLLLVLTVYFLFTFVFYAMIEYSNSRTDLLSKQLKEYEVQRKNIGDKFNLNNDLEEIIKKREAMDGKKGEFRNKLIEIAKLHLPIAEIQGKKVLKLNKYSKYLVIINFFVPIGEILIPTFIGIYSIVIILLEF